MAVNIAAFGWHATIFLGGWVLLLAGLALTVVAVLALTFLFGAIRTSN